MRKTERRLRKVTPSAMKVGRRQAPSKLSANETSQNRLFGSPTRGCLIALVAIRLQNFCVGSTMFDETLPVEILLSRGRVP